MLIRTALVLLLALAGPLSLGVGAAAAEEPGPKVERAWARATFGRSQLSVAYMTVSSPTADRLVAVETPIAEHASLHSHLMKSDGTMEMRSVEAIPLKPGESLTLKPNGEYHVMLTGLKQPLTKGESFPMTLVFERGGRKEVTVRVESARAMAPTEGAGL
jgi:copper(I)-binding protein